MNLDYPGRPNVVTLVFGSGRGREKRDPERWQHEKDLPLQDLKMEEDSHEPRNVGSL